MLKEKIINFFNVNKSGNNKKKIENLTFFLIILIITVFAINVIWKDEEDNSQESIDETKKLAVSKETYEEESLESKLEDILSNISGVGNVKVLLTYNETEEIIPVYNKKDKKSISNETDSSGGTRVTEETDTEEEVVYQDEKIITQKTVSPKIEGAIVTASGANNSGVKSNIIQAIEAATGLATHKIQVFEKQN